MSIKIREKYIWLAAAILLSATAAVSSVLAIVFALAGRFVLVGVFTPLGVLAFWGAPIAFYKSVKARRSEKETSADNVKEISSDAEGDASTEASEDNLVNTENITSPEREEKTPGEE